MARAAIDVLAQHLQSERRTYAMVGFVLRNTLSEFGAVARGVCHVAEDGYLKDITEMKSIEREGPRITNIDAEGQETVLTGDELVSMNMWGFTPQDISATLRAISAFFETVWGRSEGRVLHSETR